MVFGIVVEGDGDAAVYSALIRRIRPEVNIVISKACGNVAAVRRKFVGWLKYFQWHCEYEVGKVLVIRDSDCRGSQSVEDELANILDQSGFRTQLALPVHFYGTRCVLETWLLADEAAVDAVATGRGKSGSAQPFVGDLEALGDAKEHFIRMLSQAGLYPTAPVYGQVAAVADLDRIAARCPYFRRFANLVNAC